MHLINISNDQLLPIFHILDVEDLVNTCSINQKIKKLCNSDKTLRNRIRRYLEIEKEVASLTTPNLSFLINKYIQTKDEIKVKYLLKLYIKTQGASPPVYLLNNVMTSWDLEMTKLLIDYYDVEPIMRALYYNIVVYEENCSLPLLKYLVRKNKLPSDAYPELLESASGDKVEIVKYLLSLGVGVGFGVRGGVEVKESALEHAVESKNEEIVALLLPSGVNTNFVRDIDENTTLLGYAIVVSNFNIVKMLLQYGADPHLNNDDAIIRARKSRNPEIQDLFRRYL